MFGKHKNNSNNELQNNRNEVQNNINNPKGSSGGQYISLYGYFCENCEKANVEPIYGQKVIECIINYKNSYKSGDRSVIIDSLKKLVAELNHAPLIVPFNYDDEHEFNNDKSLHFTAAAASQFNFDSIMYRAFQMTPNQLFDLYWEFRDGIPAIDYSWWNIERIAGSKGYSIANQNDNPGARMYPCIGSDQNGSYLLVYTGIDQLKASLGEDFSGHIGVFSFGEIVNLSLMNPNATGFILNPDTKTHCFIDKNFFNPNRGN
jgi:hypothetical protein